MAENSDSRLGLVYAAINAGDVEVLSLDIFDTFLWRKVPTPEDLFLLLGRKLKDEGWLIPALTPEAFATLRAAAERTARLDKDYLQNTTEVTLTEIYWKLQTAFVKLSIDQMLSGQCKGVYESDVAEVMQLELSLEKELLRCDRNILQLIFYAKENEIPVVLVSNTYFEEGHIRNFLKDFLSENHIAAFFISCAWGCDKENGLFSEVIREMKVTPNKILHIGDNYESDILSATQKGIETLHYEKTDMKLEDIFEREWPSDLCKRQQLLDRNQGDFGITALRAKMMHHSALDTLKREEHFFWKYGATILGPILLGFVRWIYERCEQMNESKVFCLMREGKLYANLINHFAPYYPQHKIEIKHLWVSRLFITHASMANAYRKELMTTMNAFLEHFTIENFCTYLGLDIGQMQKWSDYRHVMLEDPALRKEFILYLVAHAPLRKKIIQKASEKRERFLKYLSGLTNLASSAQMTLVDVGWNGTAQIAMQQILQLANSPIHLHGLYLGTTHTTNLALLKGVISEGFLFKSGFPPCGNAHKKGCFVLEQTATAEMGVGPLQDIDEKGEIITSPVRIPAKQQRQAEVVQKGIFAFFDAVSPYIASKAIVLNADSEAFQNQLRSLLLRSMINTTQTEAFKFGSWFHEHGTTPSLTQVIGKDHYYDRFIKDMLPIAAFKESGLNWPAAYTAKQSKYLTLTSEAMWLNTLPPECFLSEDHYSLRIFLDKGKDFSRKAAQYVDLRSNPNRHFYSLVKLFSSKKALKRILLMLSFPSALVRIKSLRLVTYDKQTPKPQPLTFFESDQPTHTLECVSGEQMDFNTFYCEEHLKLIHTFENPGVYQIKLKLCCEMFSINTPINTKIK